MSLKKVFSLVSISALLLTSCVPEDGDTGPSGPVGAQGGFGPAGQDGTNGSDGTNGNDGTDGQDGIVLSSFVYSVDSSSWTKPGGINGIINSINVPAITGAIVSTGAVLLFQTEDNSVATATNWRAVPYTDGVFSHVFSYGPGIVNLKITVTLNGSVPNLAAARDHTYKVVIIPQSAKIAGFDSKTYAELKMVYGLED